MDRERAGTWLEGYRQAWEQADTPAVLELFTPDATYRSHPLRPAHTGHDGVAGYWNQATAGQRDVRVRFGTAIVDGDRVAAEWWTLMHADGIPVTLAGGLLLTFAADGRCRALRECWNLTDALVDPPPDWGRLDLGTDPGGGAEHARRWAEGYEAAWRALDPEAAAALYAPDAHYRTEPFRDPHVRQLIPDLHPRWPGRHRPRLLVPGARHPPPARRMGALTLAARRPRARRSPG